MKLETYLKHRAHFLNEYPKMAKNDFGFIKISDLKIRNLKKFIFLFSLDFIGNEYCNTNQQKKYKIKNNKIISGLKMTSSKSIFDKYPDQFGRAVEYSYLTKTRKNHDNRAQLVESKRFVI